MEIDLFSSPSYQTNKKNECQSTSEGFLELIIEYFNSDFESFKTLSWLYA